MFRDGLAGTDGNTVRYGIHRGKIRLFFFQDPAHGHKAVIHGVTVPSYPGKNAEIFIRFDSIVLKGLPVSLQTQLSDTLIVLGGCQD